ncbi:HepT-like ribonuclease domain-containing protein [Acidisphaera sp. L21]|uniref:HepT-like ribonuclease domain-containing protein n=1 Tax=Acidisphaera sp. L21 TaxID=1641851 RepID=UPI0038D035DD
MQGCDCRQQESLGAVSRRQRAASLRHARPLAFAAVEGGHGVRNVHRHDYDSVEENLIWRTVQRNLGPLLAMVEG